MMNLKTICTLSRRINTSFFQVIRATNQPMSGLPLLDSILNKVEHLKPLNNTTIIYIHHALDTSVNLVSSMIRLGACPQDIFVLGKSYSECPSAVQRIKNLNVIYQDCSKQTALGQFSQSFTYDIGCLWKRVNDHLANNANDVRDVLVLDHGGYAIKLMPQSISMQCNVVGLEKTTAGLMGPKNREFPLVPIINVAQCATKKTLESPLIAETIVKKLLPQLPKNPDKVCGVIGYGSVGRAVATLLNSIYKRVIVYDPHYLTHNEANPWRACNLSELITDSDLIFGCTGQDLIPIELFKVTKKEKILISCSSEDKEFLGLLKEIQEIQKKDGVKINNPFQELEYISKQGAKVRILNGGFPINFDHTGESVPAKDIQLTRALVLVGILQAKAFCKKSHLLCKNGIFSLDPMAQSFIVKQWLSDRPHRIPKNVAEPCSDIAWIIRNSNGGYEPCNFFNLLAPESKISTVFTACS
jgi:S-adenosylhomocysteine hydrolase